jgi:hypothetical protein
MSVIYKHKKANKEEKILTIKEMRKYSLKDEI